ncbi:hypothetical protein [Leifsonia sp. Leaf264]|uniref:hypothetical protein n=1 Tax=Leifsonia sp. Leaf264 TaxID=1736314 RepID=UPI000AB453EA|nr:hypothetical protein [Leifsonia sp. Leaf264]
MGVSAKINNADGYTWRTKVSYNGYWNTGSSTATQNGPRGHGTTYASFEYLNGTIPSERIGVSAWLLAAVMGKSAVGTLDVVEDGSESDPPASAEVTVDQLRAGDAPNFVLTYYGVIDESELWSGQTLDGETCLFVAQGENVGSTCAEATDFEQHGLSIHSQGPEHSIQAALAPHGGITKEAALAAGLEMVTDSLAVNSRLPVRGTLVLDENGTRQKGASAATGIVLVSGAAD